MEKTLTQIADLAGTRLHGHAAPATGWARPMASTGAFVIDNSVIDNSTEVSAQERRHR